MDNFKDIVTKKTSPNLALFIIIIIIIIYNYCYSDNLFSLPYSLLYQSNLLNMDTAILLMSIFLAEMLSLSWSTFILVKINKKEIKFISWSAPSTLSISNLYDKKAVLFGLRAFH